MPVATGGDEEPIIRYGPGQFLGRALLSGAAATTLVIGSRFSTGALLQLVRAGPALQEATACGPSAFMELTTVPSSEMEQIT